MGNCHLQKDFDADNIAALTKSNFTYQYCIGKGGFGKVWKVDRKKTKTHYAMKEMSKARILTKRSLKSVINERQILTQLQNPFIVNMYYAFQDRENLYLVMDYLSGGDLRYHICKHRRFTEEQTRFFIACLIAGLEYIHNKNILHRDIKPENLVFDQDGYLRITDFGIARIWRPENNQDTSGTPGYMAPEVMCRQNHGIQVDYFAVGVMAYECMFGRRPYVGKSRQEIRDHILSKQIQIKKPDIPKGWSIEAADFINKMIQRKPANRLGKNGPLEVKQHPWLKDFPWADLWSKKIQAPFIPPNQDNFDQKNINEDWKDQEDEEFQQNILSLRRNSIQQQFNGYYYDYQLAAMNVNPGLMNQAELTQYLQSQAGISQPTLQQQAPISQPVNQKVYRTSGGMEHVLSGPQLQYPRSEALSPKNSRFSLQLHQQSLQQPLLQSTQQQQPQFHHHRLQSAMLVKPSTALHDNQSHNKRGELSSSQLDQQSSTVSYYSHSRKGSSGAVTQLSRLTPQQQQFISQQIQSIQQQQQQQHLLNKAPSEQSYSDQQQYLLMQQQYKAKRSTSRSGTASTKAHPSGPAHARPWSSSVSTHHTAYQQHQQTSQQQQSQYHSQHPQTQSQNLSHHSSLLLRKTASSGFQGNNPTANAYLTQASTSNNHLPQHHLQSFQGVPSSSQMTSASKHMMSQDIHQKQPKSSGHSRHHSQSYGGQQH